MQEEQQNQEPFIIGVGSPPGGAAAVERFFAQVPADAGLSFILVQHPTADRKELLEHLTTRATLPVVEVVERQRVLPGRLHVLSCEVQWAIEGGELLPRGAVEGESRPIDAFFRSLARDRKGDAAFVLLSGAGSDGFSSLGEARQAGGFVLVQAPEQPGADRRHAAVRGAADALLPPEQMPERLLEHARWLAGVSASRGEHTGVEALLDPIFRVLDRRTGHDFSNYKRSTVLRRIERRMAALHLESAQRYLEHLRTSADEPNILLRELLISVTQFFRDPEALQMLSALCLTPLLASKPPGEAVRVWVPGCATGEEVYSLAMLLSEHTADTPREVQIFATDIDAAALDVARHGRYPESIAQDVSSERLGRFFTREDDGYRVTKRLRDMCLFSAHNVLQSPPFSQLDLLSCRNLLIYLDTPVQSRLIPLFHYALRPRGYLFLGSAETIGDHEALFDTIDRTHRIYRQRVVLNRPTIEMPLRTERVPSPVVTARPPGISFGEAMAVRALERALLDEYAPPGAVISHTGEVVYLCGRTGMYLEPPRGSAPFDLFGMARPVLRQELRGAVARAVETRTEVTTPDIDLPAGELMQRLRLVVRPLPEAWQGSNLYLVAFQEIGLPRRLTPPEIATNRSREEPIIENLERELRSSREQWRATIREMDALNAELAATSEEHQSLNEELRTSQEELQSTNEELRTVNAELHKKVEALDLAHADLQNLFDSSQLAIVLLDHQGRIRRFSPGATEVFRLIASDVGRPLTDIVTQISGMDLEQDFRDVLRTLEPRERAVRRVGDERRYLMRALPYRTLAGAVDGVVINLIDVTLVELAQENERRRAEELQTVLDAVPAVIFLTRDPEAKVIKTNERAHEHMQIPPTEVLPPALILHQGKPLGPGQLALQRAARGEQVHNMEVEACFPDGSSRWLIGNATPLRDAQGQPRGAVAAFVNITERHRAEAALRASEERYRQLVSTAEDFISRFDRQQRFLFANPAVLRVMNASLEQIVGKTSAELGRSPAWNDRLQEVFLSGQSRRFEWHGDNERWYDVQLSLEPGGEAVVSVARDITEQKAAELELRASEERYAAIHDHVPLGISLTRMPQGTTVNVNEAFLRIFELSRADIIGKTSREAGLTSDEERAQVAAELAARGSVRSFACTRRTKNGNERSLLLNLDWVELRGQKHLLTTIEDVTEKKRIERDRERLKADLIHAQKMEAIGTLAGGVAHDFNNILGGILGGLSVLDMDAPLSERQRTYVAEMMELVTRGANLAKQLLGFAHRGKYDVKPLDLAEVATKTCSMFGRTRKDIVLDLQLPADLNPVLMDHTQLEQVLLNLLLNAGQAMPDGGRISLRAENAPGDGEPPGPCVRLSVTDTGIGMDDATRERIFEPFFTTKERGQGTGLGLASVYGIIQNHSGKISVESQPGRGTTFTLLLVAATTRSAPEKAASRPLERGEGTILVVDDEEQIRTVCRRILERLGYRVLTAASGLEAIDILHEHKAQISAVILDLTMPQMSGPRTFDALRAIVPDLRVLLVSGHSIEGQARALLDRGAAGFLQKPFSGKDLSARLRDL